MTRKYFSRKWFRRLTLLCLSTMAGAIGPILFILVVFIIDFMQPEQNPIYETVSELVHGSYGWVQTISFVIFGVLLMIFALRLYLATSPKTRSILGAFFIGIAGFSFLMLGAFPSEASTMDSTPQPLLHNIAAGITGASFVLGCSSFALYFKTDPRWTKYWIYTAITSIACLFFALLWALTPLGLHAKGLDQLLMLVSGFIWLEVISIKLIRLCLAENQ